MKDELVANVIEEIRENRSFTSTELLLCFPQISGFLSHEIVTQKLDYHKFRSRWAPKVLTEVFKSQCMAALSTFSGSCEKNGSLLDHITSEVEICVKHLNCETKL